MRLGGPIDGTKTADSWVRAAKEAGYGAVYFPLGDETDDATCKVYSKAAADAGLVIAEVGAWSNPISSDAGDRAAAVAKCQKRLHQAEVVGARCCVNIVGSRNPNKWDGPDPRNLNDETLDMIVESVRTIVDAVKPVRTKYGLETMPWIFPDSADSYLRLLKAIDRPGVAVHLDVVNLINCPARAYDTTGLIHECFDKLGQWIVSCHAKDIVLREKLTVHLDEVRPGLGVVDYKTFIRRAAGLEDVPVMLEHLPGEEYPPAAEHLRQVAREVGVML
ncbi:MAG: sugar phosphate isomerase/epimerase family protein [Phycisphaerales bacterium]